MTDRVVILGAGHAGGRAAETLAAEGFQGEIVLIGNEEFPPYERPPLSKGVLRGELPKEKTFLRPAPWWAEAGINLLVRRRVQSLDRTGKVVHLDGGESIRYDKLIFATGARPRLLEGPCHASYRYLRDLNDAGTLSAEMRPGVRIAVVGAGLIGLEVAAAARTAGCQVDLIELATRAMPRIVLHEIADAMTSHHIKQGVRFHFGTKFRCEGNQLLLSSGKTLHPDLMIIGIGSIPNSELAAESGLTVQDGILVDAYGRTSDPDIYAIGDVACQLDGASGKVVRFESWHYAQESAIAVAQNMAGGSRPSYSTPWFWSDQYDQNLQCAGASSGFDRVVWRGDPALGQSIGFMLSADRLVGVQALNGGREMKFARQLLQKAGSYSGAELTDATVSLREISN